MRSPGPLGRKPKKTADEMKHAWVFIMTEGPKVFIIVEHTECHYGSIPHHPQALLYT